MKKQTGKTRVLISDDHTLFRKGVRALLEKESWIEVIGEASTGHEAVRAAVELNPDVILLDIGMAGMNGVEAARQIRRRTPRVKIIVVTMYDEEEFIREMIGLGVSGYLLKDSADNDLVSAIKKAMANGVFLCPAAAKMVADDFILGRKKKVPEILKRLTEREREVLQLIAEGQTNHQIAGLLFVSEKTVQAHRANLMKKLDIHNIAGLTRFAIHHHLTME